MSKAIELSPDPTPAIAERDSQVQAVEPETSLPQSPPLPPVKKSLRERLAMARTRLRHAAMNGLRVRVYEVALDLDMSEFHFARQFRAAYNCSPHVYYDEVRAARARDLLREGESQGVVARRIGLRRPAELRALLAKRSRLQSMVDVAPPSAFYPGLALQDVIT